MNLIHSRTFIRGFALLALALTLAPLHGCAVFQKENRRSLNGLDARIHPQSAGAQIALAPVAIPVASGALAVDAFAVNPVLAVEPAWEDTYNLYWKPREMEPLTRAMLFVPIVVLTPPTFVGSWLLNSFFMH